MDNRKVIEEYAAFNFGLLFIGILIIIINYISILQGVAFFKFEYLTSRLIIHSSQFYIFAKLAVLISTGISLINHNIRKASETKSNKISLVLIGLLFLITLIGLIFYLISSGWLCSPIRLVVECLAFVSLSLGLHFFIRLINGLEFESNSDLKDLLSPNNKSNKERKYKYFIEAVQPKKTIIELPNLTVSTLLIGGAGAGKTASVIKPIIQQNIDIKDQSMFALDPKYPELTKMIAAKLKAQNRLDKLKVIDFVDPQHRVNPIHPDYIKDDEVIAEAAEVLADNLGVKGDRNPFWRDNFTQYIQAVIFFLRDKHPKYCTLPHVISMMLDDRITTIISMCETVPQAATKILGVKVAVGFKLDQDEENTVGGSQNQTAGVLGTAFTALGKLDSQKIFYTLSANDFNLKINEAENQLYITIGNHSQFEKSLKPAIALIFSTMITQNNVDAKDNENRIPLLIPIDEFNTIHIPNIEKVPSTGRSRKLMLFVATQDLSLIKRDYGKERTDVIIASCGNIIIGNNGNPETLKMASDMIGRREATKKTKSQSANNSAYASSTNEGQSKTTQEKLVIQPHEIAEFEAGEFIAKIAGAKQRFVKFKSKYTEYVETPVPEIYKGDIKKTSAIYMNYLQIKYQAKALISEYENMLNQQKKPKEDSEKTPKKRNLQKEKTANKTAFNFVN